jgi:hypothetical protein
MLAAGGLQLEALEGQSFEELATVAEGFMAGSDEAGCVLTQLSTPFSDAVPMLALDIDRTRVYALDLDMSTVFNALGQVMGQTFINNYNQFGQVYNVMVQGNSDSRMTAMDVLQLRVKNRNGELVPFASFATASIATGTDNATHYNLYNTIQVNGSTTAGYGSGDSIKAIDEVAAATLPRALATSGQEQHSKKSSQQASRRMSSASRSSRSSCCLPRFTRSWLLPFNVLLAVSFAVLFALVALHIAGRSLDVYAQIGLVMLVGLAAKNAILIVEFAKVRADTGEAVIDAASEASRLRLRPIMMTSFAFILGILPLVVATGAGAQARHSIGVTVLGGMLGSTIMDQPRGANLLLHVLFAATKVWLRNTREASRCIRAARSGNDERKCAQLHCRAVSSLAPNNEISKHPTPPPRRRGVFAASDLLRRSTPGNCGGGRARRCCRQHARSYTLLPMAKKNTDAVAHRTSLGHSATTYAGTPRDVLKTLKDSVALVFAGDMDASIHGEFRAHPHFQYLTGIGDEPGAVLLLDPLNPVEARRAILS